MDGEKSTLSEHQVDSLLDTAKTYGDHSAKSFTIFITVLLASQAFESQITSTIASWFVGGALVAF